VPDPPSIQVTITNRLGLHARPAMAFVDLAGSFGSEVKVRRADDPGAEPVDGKSIMHVMMLAATKGAVLEISAIGDDAGKAVEALARLVRSGFGED
jgi:phosphocarrier protein HPr